MARERHDDAGEPGSSPRARKSPLLEPTRDPEDDPIVSPQEVAKDLMLRPQTMGEYVGQAKLKRKLEVFVRAARQRGEALDHVLLHGPPGLGKTTMAHIVARELGAQLHVTSGPAIEHKGVLTGHLLALGERDVFFIDEIHRLTPVVEETLYSAMEDGRVDLAVGDGSRARTMSVQIAPFTLVGATTRTALLSAPLRGRFQIVEGLEYYADDELAAIVTRTADVLGFPATREGAHEIGRRSRGTPRIANRLTRRVRDYAQVRAQTRIELDDAAYALNELGIDREGLDDMDRRILASMEDLFEGGPVGIEALSASLNEPRDTLEDVYEPFLLQRGFLIRTPRGRQLTAKAKEHLARREEG